MPILRIRASSGKEFTYRLPNAPVQIGRSPSCQIRLAGERVSRHHAQIEPAPEGFVIADLGSGNGTLVNGERVERKLLAHGDQVVIAGVTFVFDRGEAAELAEAAAPGAGTPAEGGIDEQAVRNMKVASEAIRAEVNKIIVGQAEVLDQVLAAMLARGHCLMVGVPGLAKTLMIRTIAAALDLEFKRVQFTPDLMPSDITGTEVLEEDPNTKERIFRFIKGPVFTNILLADEINRTPPKTQAALLEAMQEHRVTASGYTYRLREPFFVLATQNPIEQEGTYPLPEAQLDRFMFMLRVDYPARAEEIEIAVKTTREDPGTPQQVLTGDEIVTLQGLVRKMPVSDYVVTFAADLVRASRPKTPPAPKFINDFVTWGAGPRAVQYLTLGAKARAMLDGRVNVSCADVRAVAPIVLRHRLFTNFNADAEGVDSDRIVEMLLKEIKEPEAKNLPGAETP